MGQSKSKRARDADADLPRDLHQEVGEHPTAGAVTHVMGLADAERIEDDVEDNLKLWGLMEALRNGYVGTGHSVLTARSHPQIPSLQRAARPRAHKGRRPHPAGTREERRHGESVRSACVIVTNAAQGNPAEELRPAHTGHGLPRFPGEQGRGRRADNTARDEAPEREEPAVGDQGGARQPAGNRATAVELDDRVGREQLHHRVVDRARPRGCGKPEVGKGGEGCQVGERGAAGRAVRRRAPCAHARHDLRYEF